MVATFCNLSPVSGLEKLDEYLFKQRNLCSSHLACNPSLHFCYYAQNNVHRKYRRQLEFKKTTYSHTWNEADYSHTRNEEDEYVEVSTATLVWRAIKLPIYSVAIVPLTVGSAAAYLQTDTFSFGRYFVLLVASVMIITWLNLSNDVYDFDTGADKNKKESVVKLVGRIHVLIGQLFPVMCLGSRTGTILAAYTLLVVGFTFLTWTSIQAGNKQAILLLTCAIICGYIYQCPPFRLSYQGLGEPLCFSAFGPFATSAFYLLQGCTSGVKNLSLNGLVLAASLLVGLTTTLILFCSHFHQIEGDKAVGKMSPLVRVGTERGCTIVASTIIALYVLTLALGLSGTLPLTSILFCALTLPMAKFVMSFVKENHENKLKIFMAKYYCVRLHALFGAALAAGLVAARMVPKYIPGMKVSISLYLKNI